jgi:translation initiation factor 2 subunit 1
MYLNNKPSLHDIVFVQLGTSSDKSIGNYVQMVEYDNLEGLVLCTEITRYKSNLKTLVKRDEIFPVVVISTSNGFDLSYSKIKNSSRTLLQDCYKYQVKIANLINTITNELNLNEHTKTNIIKYNLSPKIYEQSVNEDKNYCKELFDSILVNSDILFEKFEKIEKIEDIENNFKTCLSKHILINPYIIQKEFKLLLIDSQSLKNLKDLLQKIKNINIDTEYKYEIACRTSPYYFYKISSNELTKIEEKIKYIDEQINIICIDYACEINTENVYTIIKNGEIIFN